MRNAMSDHGVFDKKAIIDRLIREVTLFYEFQGVPMEYRIVSGKYARALKPYGGVSDALEELRIDGSIEVVVTKRGSRLIYPKDGANRLAAGSALLKR